MFDLEVAQPAGEIQNVSQVGSGVTVTASGFGQAKLLGDGKKLQGTKWKHLAGLQQLLACNRHTQKSQVQKINTNQMNKMDTQTYFILFSEPSLLLFDGHLF